MSKNAKNDFGTWDDLQGAAINAKIPASSSPDYVSYAFGIGGGVSFDTLAFAVGEYIEGTYQTSHSMALNTKLHNHFHWTIPTNDSGKKFKFQVDVIAAPVGGAFAALSGSPYSVEVTLDGTEANVHNVAELGEFEAVNTDVSTIYIVRFSRVAASSGEYGSDVYVLYNDSHYIKDASGSVNEYTKG